MSKSKRAVKPRAADAAASTPETPQSQGWMESAMDLTAGADVVIVPELDDQSFADLFGEPATEPAASSRSPKQADE